MASSAPGRGRQLAVVAAAGAAVVEVVAAVRWLSEVGAVGALPGAGATPALLSTVSASVAVTVVGALLLHRGDERGTAVLVAAGLLTLPAAVAGIVDLGLASTAQLVWLVAAALLLVAAALAWIGRDQGPWTAADAPAGATGAVIAVAAVAVLAATLLPTTWYRIAGAVASDWWTPTLWMEGLDLSTMPLLLVPVVVAVVLWAGATLPRPIGAALLGTLALTGLASGAGNLLHVLGDPELWITPFGWVDLVGNLALLVVAARWWAPVARPRPDPESHLDVDPAPHPDADPASRPDQ